MFGTRTEDGVGINEMVLRSVIRKQVGCHVSFFFSGESKIRRDGNMPVM